MRLHAEVPLIPLLRGAHLRITLARRVLGGRRGSNQGRVHDRAAAQQRTACFQMIRHRFKYRLRQRMRLEQVSEVQDRRLVGDRVAAQFKMAERAHRLDVKAAADAEAKRKAEEAEQQRLAAAKAEEERKAKAAADAEAKRKAEEPVRTI